MMLKNTWYRRIYHFYKSGCFIVGIEHFLVMFPSAMLIAKLANTPFGAVMELSSILLVCGIGTLVFALFTKGKIPFFLGPSFAYIGFVSYQVSLTNSVSNLKEIRSTIFYGYLFAGIMLMLLSLFYRINFVKKAINQLFPYTVMGPAISLIGLELANMALEDSGFTGNDSTSVYIAIITLVCIIIASLTRHHFLQNASVLLGVLIGCIVATFWGIAQWPIPNLSVPIIKLPSIYLGELLHFPNNWIALILSMIPPTIIAFVESLGRIAVYESMLKRDGIDYNNTALMSDSISMHAISNIITSICGLMPNAIYAENLAIMNLHNSELSTKYKLDADEDNFVVQCYAPYSIYPYILAAGLCLIIACFGDIQHLFASIPIPILGGMELFVFGLISAPGIQILVDQQINYKKVSNQIITASVLLAGVGDVAIRIGAFSLQGMSLGLVIGVMVNLLTILLEATGLLNETFSIVEILDECLNLYGGQVSISSLNENGELSIEATKDANSWKEHIRRKDVRALLTSASKIDLADESKKRQITIDQNSNMLILNLYLPPQFQRKLVNDNKNIIAVRGSNRITSIIVNEHLSKKLLRSIIEKAI